MFEELEAELSRASIPLIKIDSKKHVIKPPGELPGSYPVFLKAQDSPPRRLFGGGDPISLPPKRVERLYAAPEGFRRAKEILSRLPARLKGPYPHFAAGLQRPVFPV